MAKATFLQILFLLIISINLFNGEEKSSPTSLAFKRLVHSLEKENITNFEEDKINKPMLMIILQRNTMKYECNENFKNICKECLNAGEILHLFNKSSIEVQDFDKLAAYILELTWNYPESCNVTHHGKHTVFDNCVSNIEKKLDDDDKVFKAIEGLVKNFNHDQHGHEKDHDHDHGHDHDHDKGHNHTKESEKKENDHHENEKKDDDHKNEKKNEDDHDHDHDHDHEHKPECFNAHTVLYLANSAPKEKRAVAISSTLISYILSNSEYKEKNCKLKNSTLPLPSEFSFAIFEHFGKKPYETLNSTDLEHIMNKLNIGKGKKSTESEKHEDSHEGHNHRRRKRSVAEKLNINSVCYSSEELMNTFQFKNELDGDRFEEICPALIQQQMFGPCSSAEKKQSKSDPPTTAEKYGYSLLAVFIVSCCALLGGLIQPCSKSTQFNFILSALIASGFGALTADALLHLIPEAFGLHNHGAHEGEHPVTIQEYTKKALGTVAAIYCFFILELVLSGFASSRNVEENEKELQLREKGQHHNHGHSHHHHTTSVMVVVGDGVHNFADGLIIGAAFSVSVTSGISTSLAVFVHELAHEFGDLALLVDAGLSLKKALLLNGISALTCFVGAIIGVAVAVDTEVRKWIFAVAAGMFLYIAMANMISQLGKSLIKCDKKILLFIVINVGAIIGLAALTLLAVYEEKIRV